MKGNATNQLVSIDARPQPVEIELQRSAIIVVDMQNAYAKKGGMLDLGTGIDESRVAPVVAANQRLLSAARQAGVKVIYLQFGYNPDLSDAGGPESPNIRKQMAFKLLRDGGTSKEKAIVKGTWGWQIIDEIEPRPGDLVVDKARYSGFAGTTLENQLNGLGIRYLFFTGIATNVCVESTAREAYFREFWPILVEDAMDHTGPDFVRDATFYNFENKMGWVTSTEKIIAAMLPE